MNNKHVLMREDRRVCVRNCNVRAKCAKTVNVGAVGGGAGGRIQCCIDVCLIEDDTDRQLDVIITGHADGTVRVSLASTGKCVRTVRVHTMAVACVAVCGHM